jgi:hypothetical protein
MFQITVVDHIRLSFGHVMYSHQAHAHAADRLTRRAFQMKVTTIVLTGITLAVCIVALDTPRGFRVAAAVLAGLAFAAHAGYLAFDLEPRIYGHRSCAARLWLIAEQYRALLAEIQDGMVHVETVVARRDALQREVQAVYEHAPPADRQAYQIAKKTLSGKGEVLLTDEDLDRFLPESLRKGDKPAAA